MGRRATNIQTSLQSTERGPVRIARMARAAGFAFVLLIVLAMNTCDADAGQMAALHAVEEIPPAVDRPLAEAREELGEADEDEDDLGRRGGGGLSAAGSFVVSSGSNTAGNDEEDEEDEAQLGDEDEEVLRLTQALAKAKAKAKAKRQKTVLGASVQQDSAKPKKASEMKELTPQ